MRQLLLGGFLVMSLSAHATQDLFSVPLQTIDGKAATLNDYKGKTLLIVNTASRCGYTPQYEGLEEIYSKYQAKGLVVLGFPSNDFGGQEPGSNGEIKKFCTVKFHVDFPMFAKGPVKGDAKQPLYAYLTANAPQKGEIKWNFEKFLISPDGNVVGRFDSKVKPTDTTLTAAIEKNLPK
jgi:glutathione peroxidase